MRKEELTTLSRLAKRDYWYSIKILATVPGGVAVLAATGYIYLSLMLAGLLIYLYFKDGDIRMILAEFHWTIYFPIMIAVLGGLMAYFSSAYLYIALGIVMFAFLLTASWFARKIEFEK